MSLKTNFCGLFIEIIAFSDSASHLKLNYMATIKWLMGCGYCCNEVTSHRWLDIAATELAIELNNYTRRRGKT